MTPDDTTIKTPQGSAPTGMAAPHSSPQVPDHELIRLIGRGSYGEVWLARSVMGTYRAVKVVYRSRFETDRPFEREFSGIQNFEPISRGHEGLVDLLQVGRNDRDGYFYCVMELADDENTGQTINPENYRPKSLRSETVRHGRLPFEESVRLGLSLAAGLSHLHEHGLIHRDIKPSNIIFVNGMTKLADIGLVADVGEAKSFVGTEGFIPPEGPGTAQADIYSLGKVLYEISTGKDRQAFPEPPTLQVEMTEQEQKQFLELNEVILKACEGDSRKRYPSAEVMRADLLLLQSGRSVKRLRVVERRLAILTKVGVVMAIFAVVASGILYQTARQRRIATRNLVRLHVANGTSKMNEGDLFGSLLSFTEALRLDKGNAKREEPHRIRIASVLRECPKLVGLFTHDGAIKQAAFSPDSRLVITASEDQTARVWDVATGQRRFSLVHPGQVYSASFSPNAKLIATTSSDNKVHIWNAETGEQLRRGPIRHLARNAGPHPQFSPDGERILAVDTSNARNTIRLWNAVTGEALGQPLPHDHEVSFFEFSADGRCILTISGDNQARVWNGFTGEKIFSCEHSGLVKCGAFIPDGRIFATGGDDNCVRFWDLSSGKAFAQPLALRQAVDSVGFSPDGGRLVTACQNKTVEIWDVVTRAPLLRRPLLHDLPVKSAHFNPDGRRIVTESQGNLVRMWDADTGELLAPPLKHDTRGEVAFSPDGHLVLTMQRDEAVRVWNLAIVAPPPFAIQPAATFRERSVSSDKRFKASLSGDTIRTLDENSQPLPPITQKVPFRQAFFSSDNSKLVTEDADTRARVWDLLMGEPLTPPLKARYDLAPLTPPLKAHHAMVERAPIKVDLPRDDRPTANLVLLAQLLSGSRVEETGGVGPLEPSDLTGAWEKLSKTKYPESFADSGDEVLRWHEQEATSCEQQWNWWATVFHLKCLARAKPKDQSLQQRLDYARTALDRANKPASGYREKLQTIPPRDQRAPANTVNLSGYYSGSLKGGEDSLSDLPSGVQTFGGTVFDVRGIVQVSGRQARAMGDNSPERVTGVRIGRKCALLHFLHATGFEAIHGTPVGSYVIHYADDQTKQIPIVYGNDVRNLWTLPEEPLTTEHSDLVWMGTNPQVQSAARSLRLFKTNWTNPRADVEIVSVDFVSSMSDAAPFLVAMTAD